MAWPGRALRSCAGSLAGAGRILTEGVRRYLFESLGGERVLTGGLRIETSLDIEQQKAAVAALQEATAAQARHG